MCVCFCGVVCLRARLDVELFFVVRRSAQQPGVVGVVASDKHGLFLAGQSTDQSVAIRFVVSFCFFTENLSHVTIHVVVVVFFCVCVLVARHDRHEQHETRRRGLRCQPGVTRSRALRRRPSAHCYDRDRREKHFHSQEGWRGTWRVSGLRLYCETSFVCNIMVSNENSFFLVAVNFTRAQN